MENDYYLHNFHVMNARNATAYMRNHERAFCINCTDDEDEVESPRKLQPVVHTLIPPITSFVESERIARIRKHSMKQNLALSSWWKAALHANLQEKKLLRFGTMLDNNALPGRFERIYQPEKLTQFDRVFSRVWETPVRRSHAAQHAEGADGDDSCDFARVIAVDVFPSTGRKDREDSALQSISIRNVFSAQDFHFNKTNKLHSFVQFFDRPATSSLYSGAINHDYCSEITNPPDMYRQYCDPMSSKFQDRSKLKVEDFNKALHDVNLSANDVAGICEVIENFSLHCIIQFFDMILTLSCIFNFIACSIESSR
jgi:hypothetical protein